MQDADHRATVVSLDADNLSPQVIPLDEADCLGVEHPDSFVTAVHSFFSFPLGWFNYSTLDPGSQALFLFFGDFFNLRCSPSPCVPSYIPQTRGAFLWSYYSTIDLICQHFF